MHHAFDISVEITGAVGSVLLAAIIFGGVYRIGRVAELIMPFMAGAYILMVLVIVALNFRQIPNVSALIFRSAFDLEPAPAGILGSAVTWGIKRGIYSNEAGQGTAPHTPQK